MNAHSAENDAVTSVEPGCTCGGMAACPQCQDRDAQTAAGGEAPMPDAEKDAGTCRHCGKPPEADGDHSCPCPYRDDDCPDHPLVKSRLTASPWPKGKPLGAPPPWPTRVTPPGGSDA